MEKRSNDIDTVQVCITATLRGEVNGEPVNSWERVIDGEMNVNDYYSYKHRMLGEIYVSGKNPYGATRFRLRRKRRGPGPGSVNVSRVFIMAMTFMIFFTGFFFGRYAKQKNWFASEKKIVNTQIKK